MLLWLLPLAGAAAGGGDPCTAREMGSTQADTKMAGLRPSLPNERPQALSFPAAHQGCQRVALEALPACGS
jgi:hypothetical protein